MEDIHSYRINDIKHLIESLESKKLKLERKLQRGNKITSVTSSISLSVASIAAILGSTSLAVSAIPTAPIIICLASTCAISTSVGKVFTKKNKKRSLKINELEKKINSLKVQFSKAMDDNLISEEEYNELIKFI